MGPLNNLTCASSHGHLTTCFMLSASVQNGIAPFPPIAADSGVSFQLTFLPPPITWHAGCLPHFYIDKALGETP